MVHCNNWRLITVRGRLSAFRACRYKVLDREGRGRFPKGPDEGALGSRSCVTSPTLWASFGFYERNGFEAGIIAEDLAKCSWA